MTVVWHGLEILNKSKRAIAVSEEEMAKKIAETAKKLCPKGDFERAPRKRGGEAWSGRRPGKLRDAIKYAKSKYKNKGWIVFVPGQGSETYYVRWVELGAPARSEEQWRTAGHRHKVPRQPFLRPARERVAKKFKPTLIKHFFKRVTI